MIQKEASMMQKKYEETKQKFELLIHDEEKKHNIQRKQLQEECEATLQQVKQKCSSEIEDLKQRNREIKKEYETDMKKAKKKYNIEIEQMEQTIKIQQEKLEEDRIEVQRQKDSLHHRFEQEKQTIKHKLKLAKKCEQDEIIKINTKVQEVKDAYEDKLKRFDEECKITHEQKKQQIEELRQEQLISECARNDELLVSHKRIIDYLFHIIENAIAEALKICMQYKVYKDITESKTSFQHKENFKLKVLTYLLEEESFDEYKLYFTNPEESFKKWMCVFVKKHCFKFGNSNNVNKFHALVDEEIDSLLKPIKSAIEVTDIDGYNLTFYSWIRKFLAEIYATCKSLPLGEHNISSEIAMEWKSVREFKEFQTMFLNRINPNLLKIDSRELYNNIEDELNEYMWKNLKESLLGCTECCPFCKEMCDSDSVCGPDENHFIKLHRPECFSKRTWHQTNYIIIDFCTTAIGSDCRFRNKDTNFEWKPYKEFKDVYKNWDIFTTVNPIEPYWVWVVITFDEDIAKWCNGKAEGIPKEWYATKKCDAKKCLKALEN